MAEVDVQKRIRALRKKLAQIDKLKEKESLSPEEQEKVASEKRLLAEVAALERGEEYDPVQQAQEAQAAPQEETAPEAPPEAAESPGEQAAQPEPAEPELPEVPDLAPVEAEKRIKALNKKLGQIQKLKERGTKLSPEEEEKVSNETVFRHEMTELEIRLLDPEAQKAAKALQKKLDQITKLKDKKDKSELTPQEREKLSKGPALQKEFQTLLESRPTFKEPPPATNGHTAPKVQTIEDEDGFAQKVMRKGKQKA